MGKLIPKYQSGGKPRFTGKLTKYNNFIFTDNNGLGEFAYGVKPGEENIKYYDNDGDGVFTDRISIPDWMYDRGARAVHERQQRAQYDAKYGKGTYNAKKDQERTQRLIKEAQKPTTTEKILHTAADVASVIGMGTDMVTKVPVYSSLKAAKSYSDAINNKDLRSAAEGVLWSMPLAGGIYTTMAGKTIPEIGIMSDEANKVIENVDNSINSHLLCKLSFFDLNYIPSWQYMNISNKYIPKWLKPSIDKNNLYEIRNRTKQAYENLPKKFHNYSNEVASRDLNRPIKIELAQSKEYNKLYRNDNSLALNANLKNGDILLIKTPTILFPWQRRLYNKNLRGTVAHEFGHSFQVRVNPAYNFDNITTRSGYWPEYKNLDKRTLQATPYTTTENRPSLAATNNGFWKDTGDYWSKFGWKNSPNELLSEIDNMREKGWVQNDGTLNKLGKGYLKWRFNINDEQLDDALFALGMNGEYQPMATKQEITSIPTSDLISAYLTKQLNKIIKKLK